MSAALARRPLRRAPGALLLLTLAAPASAEDPEALIQQGVALRREGRNAEALARFQAAWAAAPSPRARAQIGLAQHSLGAWLDAEVDLDDALSAVDDPWITRNRPALEAARETVRSRLGWIDVTCDRPGAELYLDGVRTGTVPLARPRRVVAGRVQLELRLEGYNPALRPVDVRPGLVSREQLTLVPLAPSSAAGPGPTLPAPARFRPAPWILGAAGLALAGGVVAHVVREQNAAIYDDDTRCLQGELTRDQRCGAYREAAQLGGALAVAGYATGALGAALGTYLLLAEEPDMALACAAAAGGAYCRLRF